MILTITTSIDESVLNSALLAKIEKLEQQIKAETEMNYQYRELYIQAIKKQFPKTWFGGRLGKSIELFLVYLSEQKITKEIDI